MLTTSTVQAPAATTGRWTRDPAGSSGRFEGADVGGLVSGFVVDAEPGAGPALHRHPYGETFVVLSGRGRFAAGDQTLDLGPGDLLRVAPDVAHRFTALGPDRLRLVAIHAAARIEQTMVVDAA